MPVQPPTTVAELSKVEKRLGFPLPALLRRLYTEVANGGVGLVFGLIPLTIMSLGNRTPAEAEFELAGDYVRLVKRYASKPQEGGWPPGLVPVFYCGCTVFEFVDCRSPEGPMVWFDEGSEKLADLADRRTVPQIQRDFSICRTCRVFVVSTAEAFLAKALVDQVGLRQKLSPLIIDGFARKNETSTDEDYRQGYLAAEELRQRHPGVGRTTGTKGMNLTLAARVTGDYFRIPAGTVTGRFEIVLATRKPTSGPCKLGQRFDWRAERRDEGWP
jgi:hypothetical protein